MNKEDIIRMAREAGCKPFRSPEHWDDVQVFATPDVLERFAALVAAAEREACAKFIEHDYVRQFERPWRDDLSAAIRARSKQCG